MDFLLAARPDLDPGFGTSLLDGLCVALIEAVAQDDLPADAPQDFSLLKLSIRPAVGRIIYKLPDDGFPAAGRERTRPAVQGFTVHLERALHRVAQICRKTKCAERYAILPEHLFRIFNKAERFRSPRQLLKAAEILQMLPDQVDIDFFKKGLKIHNHCCLSMLPCFNGAVCQ